MIDRVLLWEISQIRRGELLESARPFKLGKNALPSRVVAGLRQMLGCSRPAWAARIHVALPPRV